MERRVRLSATVSEGIRELLERHVRATDVKRAPVVEQALRHHLQALYELPVVAIARPNLVVTGQSGETLMREIATARPTRPLRDLLREKG